MQYSTAEVKKAEEAYTLLKNAGYPSVAELINLVGGGNVSDMPALTHSDITRAYDIFGQPPEYVRGKLTKKKVNRATFDVALRSNEAQTLWSDVIHIDQNSFFVTVSEPMQLVMVNSIRSEDTESLGEALQDPLKPEIMYVDPASGLMSPRTQFPGVVIDPCGAGDHVPKIDIHIRRLKEMYHRVKAGLPWTLPRSQVKDLMMYCVSCVNLRRTSALDGTVCPKVLFTGLKPNYRKELSLAFGDYVEVYSGTDNTSRERSVPCIALYPVGNATSTWQFWNLHTKRYMRHSMRVRMRHSELVSDIINGIAEDEYSDNNVELPTDNAIDVEEQQAVVEEEINSEEEKVVEENTGVQQIVTVQPVVVGEEEAEASVVVQETGGPETRCSTRIAAGVRPPERFIHASFIEKSRWNEELSQKAIKAEVNQLFKELKALEPVKVEKIIAGAYVLTCHMFLVQKYFANGEPDKVKA
jgi:hypothetical protein